MTQVIIPLSGLANYLCVREFPVTSELFLQCNHLSADPCLQIWEYCLDVLHQNL